MQRIILLGMAFGMLLGLAQFPAHAQGKQHFGAHEVVANELLVKTRTGLAGNLIEAIHQKIGGRMLRNFTHVGWQHVRLPQGMSIDDAISRYKQLPDVTAVEPNYIVYASATPNDPSMSQLWGMAKIQAPTAWDTTTGNNTVVVAVVDSGVNYSHLDLRDNMWRNPAEVAGNSTDDDGNGYVDDVYGINAITGSANPLDDAGHGTHVAGTIGAVGNNGLGVTGVNWHVKIMALKFLGADGSGSTADAVTCYNYLIAMKQRGVNVRVVNDSWGGSGFSQSLKDAIDAAGNQGIVSVVAAGNNHANNDSVLTYPADFNSPSIIAVAASDQNDNPASFTNYGASSVALAAPGVLIYSTYYNSTTAYATMSGTSMASPHVAGAAALMLSVNNGLTIASIKSTLLNTVDKLSQWSGRVASGGRLNLAKAVQAVGGVAPPPPPSYTYQPDLLIRANSSSTTIGGNIYGAGSSETVTQTVLKGATAVYQVQLQNDGNTADSFVITAPAIASGWTVRYFDAVSGGNDISSQLTGAGWHTAVLNAGVAQSFRVEVTPGSGVAANASAQVVVSAKSAAATTKTDAVTAVTIVGAARVSSVTLAATPLSPQPVNTPITLTATSSGAAAEYQFQVGVSGWFGWTYTTIRSYSTTPTMVWQPTTARSYTLKVLARGVGSTTTSDAYTTISYTVTTPTTTAAPAAQAPSSGRQLHRIRK